MTVNPKTRQQNQYNDNKPKKQDNKTNITTKPTKLKTWQQNQKYNKTNTMTINPKTRQAQHNDNKPENKTTKPMSQQNQHNKPKNMTTKPTQ